MAYLALARKYRPQRFADIIGQEHVTRTLENAIKTDRVHHAYLFCGVRGLGKTTAARILAKALVCEQGPTPEPCNVCAQCVAITQGRSVDVIEIDGASNNSVEDVRSLRDQVNYLPQSARRKIYIIDEVHMLSTQAFNALLKTLEEPPPHVTFMFATTDPHKVLATILSRVSRLDYRRVSAATLVPYLKQILDQEGFAVEDEGLHVIARQGEGSVRDSLTLLDKVIAFAQDPNAIATTEVLAVLGQAGRFAIAELIGAVLARDAQQVLARFEDMTSTGSDLMRLAVAILQHLRDLTVVKLTDNREALLDMSDDLYEQIRVQAAQVEATIIAQHFDRFARVVDNLEHSRVPRLVIEMGLLELCNAEPLIPLGDLVARLDALAAGRSGPGPGTGRGGGGGRARPAARRRGDDDGAPAMYVAPAGPSSAATEPGPRTELARPSTAQPFVAAAMTASPAAPKSAAAPRQAAPRQDSPRQDSSRQAAPRQDSPRQAAPRQAAPRQDSPRQTAVEDAELARYEQLARDAGLLPNSPGASAPSHSPASRPPSVPPRSERSPAPTPTPTDEFALTNEELSEPAPPQRDAGCPSSRCTPREAIAWHELDRWDAWESFLSRIRDEHDLLCGVLHHLGLVGLDAGAIELAAPAAGFAQTQLRENPELKIAFEHFTAEYFGEVMQLRLIDATPSLPHMPSLALVDAERHRSHRETIHRDAEHNPRIRALLSTFSGQLLAVEPLEGPSLPPLGQRGLPKSGS